MIKRFDEYIEEGLWKSTVERAKKGLERLEDGKSNIEKLKAIDLGVDIEFADVDFKMGGKLKFTQKEARELEPYFEKHGWRLPTKEDIKNCRGDVIVTIEKIRHWDGRKPMRPLLVSRVIETDDVVKFRECDTYWLKNEIHTGWPNLWMVGANYIDAVSNTHMLNEDRLRIRLVRDKK